MLGPLAQLHLASVVHRKLNDGTLLGAKKGGIVVDAVQRLERLVVLLELDKPKALGLVVLVLKTRPVRR